MSSQHNISFVFAETLWPSPNRIGETEGIQYEPVQIFGDPYGFFDKHVCERFFIKRATNLLLKNKEKYDVVEGQGINSVAGINAGIPAVATIHGVEPWVGDKSSLHEKTLKESDKLVAITTETRDALRREGIADEKIHLVYNGVDVDSIRDHADSSMAELSDKYNVGDSKSILSVSGFEEKKNVRLLIDSFVEFAEDRESEYQLILVGDGKHRQKHVNYCRDNDYDSVVFTGRIPDDDLYRFYNSSDLFVLPSESESWGIVFLEAMAGRCPTIMTTECGVLEVVDHGEHTIAIESRDVETLVDAMALLFDDTTTRRRMVERGFKKSQEFSWERQAEQFRSVVETLS